MDIKDHEREVRQILRRMEADETLPRRSTCSVKGVVDDGKAVIRVVLWRLPVEDVYPGVMVYLIPFALRRIRENLRKMSGWTLDPGAAASDPGAVLAYVRCDPELHALYAPWENVLRDLALSESRSRLAEYLESDAARMKRFLGVAKDVEEIIGPDIQEWELGRSGVFPHRPM